MSGLEIPATGPGGAGGAVRVRFAPSPTGSLHVGGARTALFNWLFARRHGGAFVLRIEDTDLERNREEASRWITVALGWLGLDWDEGPGREGAYGPYFQSQRLDHYHEATQDLLDRGLAYPCFCTRDELAARREEARRQGTAPRYDGRCRGLKPEERQRLEANGRPRAVRLAVPETGTTVVDDIIRGRVEFDHATLDDFVLLKSDGMPTYNFACVVDDLGMRISHVIRAEEHLSNTPRQLLLYRALGQDPPRFAHVPMILAPDRSKLSKRHGAASVEEFRDQGFLPQALVNYLALLGWSPPQEGREFFTLAELAREFDLDRVAKTAAIYDVGKLAWFNGYCLRELDPGQALEVALPFFVQEGLVPPEPPPELRRRVSQAIELLRPRVRTLVELAQACAYFFGPVRAFDPEGWKKWVERPGVRGLLEAARKRLQSLPAFDAATIEKAYRELAAELGVPTPELFHATRVVATGSTMGAGLFQTMSLLGVQVVSGRLEEAISRLERGSGGGE